MHFTWEYENYVRSDILNINMSGEGLCIKIVMFTRLKFRKSVLEILILVTTHVRFTWEFDHKIILMIKYACAYHKC